MSEIWTDLVIREETLAKVDGTLEHLLEQSLATCALLINRNDGSLITAHGVLEGLDTVSLAALAAGSFVSAREIARLVGEPEFSVLFHQGEHEHVHVNLAGPHALLMTLFDDRTAIGLVRLCAREASDQIAKMLP